MQLQRLQAIEARYTMQCYTLVYNAGKPKSIRETIDEVFKSVPYCIQLLEGPYVETRKEVVDAFRPPAERRIAKP